MKPMSEMNADELAALAKLTAMTKESSDRGREYYESLSPKEKREADRVTASPQAFEAHLLELFGHEPRRPQGFFRRLMQGLSK
jgi:hypothetical protein